MLFLLGVKSQIGYGRWSRPTQQLSLWDEEWQLVSSLTPLNILPGMRVHLESRAQQRFYRIRLESIVGIMIHRT